MKVCKAKKKGSSVLMKANLVKQMKYSTLIIKEKTAPYVANVKLERENVSLEIDAGASVGILNKKARDLICCNSSVNLLPISSKLKSYSGEMIYPLGEIV